MGLPDEVLLWRIPNVRGKKLIILFVLLAIVGKLRIVAEQANTRSFDLWVNMATAALVITIIVVACNRGKTVSSPTPLKIYRRTNERVSK